MEIAIRHGHVEVPPELRAAVEDKIVRLARHLEGIEQAEVRFSEERNPRIAQREVCEITMHGHGHIVRAKAAGHDMLAAVDRVVEKLEHRLEKLKGRLLARPNTRKSGGRPASARGGEAAPPPPARGPRPPALRPGSLDFAADRSDPADQADRAAPASSPSQAARRVLAGLDGLVDEADEGQARIVKTKQFSIKPMTPEEAALQMELLGHDFFLFTNAETDRAAVVYRRRDGDIGLIDAT